MKKALYLLAAISDRDFEWLLQAGRSKKLSTGTVLIQEGELTDALYIVLQGTLSVSVEALGGEEIARLSTGEVVGEMSFVDARLPSATVTAIEETVVWSISRTQLAAKLSNDISFSSHFYQSIAAFLSDRLRNTVSRFGPTKEEAEAEGEESPNPQVSGNLDLAKARLEWLLDHLKTLH